MLLSNRPESEGQLLFEISPVIMSRDLSVALPKPWRQLDSALPHQAHKEAMGPRTFECVTQMFQRVVGGHRVWEGFHRWPQSGQERIERDIACQARSCSSWRHPVGGR